MEQEALQYFTALQSGNEAEQYYALGKLLELLKKPVDWTYSVWERLVQNLSSSNSLKRSYAVQLLCALAANSDPEERVLDDFAAIWAVTFDEAFPTAQKCIQSIWKIGLAGKAQRELVVAHLANRYVNCIEVKNCTLIRYNIIESLHKLYDATGEMRLKEISDSLIEKENDSENREKYASVWG